MKKFQVSSGAKSMNFDNFEDAKLEFEKHSEATLYQFINPNKRLVHSNRLIIMDSFDYEKRNLSRPKLSSMI